MCYCSPVLLRILGPQTFIEQFLASFTWRGIFNNVYQNQYGEYMTAYETYSVCHKYYRDSNQFNDKQKALQTSLSDYVQKGAHFNKQYLTQLCGIILAFSEPTLGQIFYLFHIWRDDLLIPTQWHPNEKRGAAWNVKFIYSLKRIFQDIVKQNPNLRKSLKYNTNFRITMTIIRRSGYHTMNEDMFYKLITSKSDVVANGQFMEETGWGTESLPVWKSAYPGIQIGGNSFEPIKCNIFCNGEWIEDTQILKTKHEIMNNNSFEKNKKVKLKGLKSKPEWNGLIGVIDDDYNFKKERWIINIGAPVNHCALIKTCNIS
eukprot:745795_1